MAAGRPAERPRPSDLLLDGFSLAFTDGRSAAAPVLEQAATGFAGDDVSIEEVLRWGWLATAAAVMVWDYDTCLAVATRGVELAREAGALAVLAVSVNVMTQAVVLGGEFGQGGAAGRRGRQRHRRHGRPGRALRRPRARRLSGPGGGGLRADRRHHRGVHGRRPGNRGPIRALGTLGAPQRPWPLPGGAGRRAGRERRHAGAVRLRVGGDRAARSRDQKRRAGARARRARAHRCRHRRCAHRLGARHPGPFPRAAERGRGRRAPVSRGNRAAGPHPAAPGARPRSPALRRVVAPRESPRRRARATPRRARAAHVDRHGGVRRARPRASCRRPARRCASGRSRRATS